MIKKYLEFIKEEADHKHEYGCVMLGLDCPNWKEVTGMIHPDDVYHHPTDPSYGLEDNPHVTLKFGLHPEIEESQIDILIQALDLEFIKYHDYLFRDTKITCNDFLCYVSHLIVKFSDSFITEWTLLLFKSIFEAYDCDMNTYTKGAQISCGNGIFERMITIIGDLLCPKYDIPRQIVPITEEEICRETLLLKHAVSGLLNTIKGF